MNDHVGDVYGLVLRVRSYIDVGELWEFFDGRKDGRDRFLRMVSRLLDYVLAIKEFVRYQLPVVVL